MTIDLILEVLDRHKDKQVNLASSAARELLATEIEAVLTSKSTSNR